MNRGRQMILKDISKDSARAGRWHHHLTTRQAQVLQCVRKALARYGRPPTRRQMAAELGLGFQTVAFHVERLKIKGFLAEEPDTRATLRATIGKPGCVRLWLPRRAAAKWQRWSGPAHLFIPGRGLVAANVAGGVITAARGGDA